jgi:hypothetical protein
LFRELGLSSVVKLRDALVFEQNDHGKRTQVDLKHEN